MSKVSNIFYVFFLVLEFLTMSVQRTFIVVVDCSCSMGKVDIGVSGEVSAPRISRLDGAKAYVESFVKQVGTLPLLNRSLKGESQGGARGL
jgi:hypothetical protein